VVFGLSDHSDMQNDGSDKTCDFFHGILFFNLLHNEWKDRSYWN
jgi:hypothetical protein